MGKKEYEEAYINLTDMLDYNDPDYTAKIEKMASENAHINNNYEDAMNIETKITDSIKEQMEKITKQESLYLTENKATLKSDIEVSFIQWNDNCAEIKKFCRDKCTITYETCAIEDYWLLKVYDNLKETEVIVPIGDYVVKYDNNFTVIARNLFNSLFVIKNNFEHKISNNIEFVNLGLPSGTLWMKCNLGAEKETDYGLYYQWGATTGYTGDEAKAHSTWRTAPFNNGSNSFDETYWNSIKSTVLDNGTTLKTTYDCVYQATNGLAKLPTKAQIDELCALSTKGWKTNYNGTGINGWEFTGNEQTLFVPAAGCFSYGNFYDAGGEFYCWSSSLFSDYEDIAWGLYGSSLGVDSSLSIRFRGVSARGVLF